MPFDEEKKEKELEDEMMNLKKNTKTNYYFLPLSMINIYKNQRRSV